MQASQKLLEQGSDSPKLDAELILCHLLGKSRSYLFGWGDEPLLPSIQSQANELLERRLAGEPVAYLIGFREFWSLRLQVNPSTLIPRPDTETLVEWALELPLLPVSRVLDLGTGTGAIALALASEQPSWQVEAVDLKQEAVELAISNARMNGLDRVKLYQSDWFEKVSGRFDLIVSNPPYIDPEDPHLSQGDVRFEPSSALTADEQGLADLRFLSSYAKTFLKEGGWLLMEHGYDQAQAVQGLLKENGFVNVTTREDLAGQPRVTGGQWPEGIVLA